MNNDSREHYRKAPIYSMSMSASQGIDYPTVTAVIGYAEETKSRSVTVTWDLPHAINADGVETEWLYAVLSRVLQDFDDHTVVRMVQESFPAREEAQDAEA